MSGRPFNFESFREKLDSQHDWPAPYTYKFIVPKGKEEEVKALFPGHDLVTKPSSKGNYLSLTARVKVDSSDEIIAVYKKAGEIPGLISL